MFHIILFNPEIPPNTGNIMRLCSNTGSNLHLIKPLGFDLNSKNLKRAALDYSEISNLKVYDSLEDCFSENKFNNIFAITNSTHCQYLSTQILNVGLSKIFLEKK